MAINKKINNDCGCGKSVKITDNTRKKNGIKKVVPKK